MTDAAEGGWKVTDEGNWKETAGLGGPCVPEATAEVIGGDAVGGAAAVAV